jgi:hypothetical protein
LVKPQLAFLAPGLRQLMLVEQPEFHRPVSYWSEAAVIGTLRASRRASTGAPQHEVLS